MTTKKTNSLWQNIFKRAPSWAQRVSELWADTSLFNGIPNREITLLAKNMHSRQYDKDEYIFHCGDKGIGAAMVISGKVEIRSGDVVLSTLTEGDFFGEISLVLDENRTADAVAIEHTELVFFIRPEFEKWISRAPRHGARLGTNLAHILAKRLSHANVMLADAAQND